ncbi:MAG: LPXTG cell wall anchor domain-containing protein [Flavisolibacter sp.]|jgi:LPXTG-motif cell wall-anchored protein|nr:LPXTG cell wall anchor domain-containing protein [Flavisolibacter sp.]
MNAINKLFLIFSIFCATVAVGQDATVPIESMESSYENKDLILLAIAGFAVLMAGYFLFRRSKKRRSGY